MKYDNIAPAVFISRPNRFVAQVELAGKPVICHVKNTGRCRELLLPGVQVWLTHSENPQRKTAWDLVTVEKAGQLINLDSSAPNSVFGEFARRGTFLPETQWVRSEVRYGDSRFDFAVMAGEQLHYIEVKGVTLEDEGAVFFPDAPTLRGEKHVRELIRAKQAGFGAHLVFVIQMERARYFAPNARTHPDFARALADAQAAGVDIRAYCCRVTPDSLELGAPVPVFLQDPQGRYLEEPRAAGPQKQGRTSGPTSAGRGSTT